MELLDDDHRNDQPQDAENLLVKAAEWRAKAKETQDTVYVALMLRTADELEERACSLMPKRPQ